ncbi:hypothetical protein CHH28_11125 [Bacterioplanes sanyensis]|uniref:Transcriptional regulator n=2 Tax=Bacterioplanes sanyensis TaxID=1249553 RepID=A0A222FJG7_9GAMM|nr:hypothetical protein CHH28_11125 [Bacterioplanes sanyensis]
MLLVVATTGLGNEARSWLDRMSHAAKEQNYQGVLIYGAPERWETMAINHAVYDDTEYEKLVHLTGERREVIRRGHAISCSHPGDHAVRVNPTSSNPLNTELWRDLGDLESWYRLSLAGEERIAGRMTQIVRVLPRDQYRFGYDLWLDRDTALLLRSDLVRHDGVVLERLQFANVAIGIEMAKSEFEPDYEGHHLARHNHAEVSPVAATNAWQPGWVPSGFAPVNRGQSHGRHLATLMYTDGLAAFSVFVDRLSNPEQSRTLRQQWGATAAIVHDVLGDDGSYRITVVGEVPMQTAEKIAASVSVPALLTLQEES